MGHEDAIGDGQEKFEIVVPLLHHIQEPLDTRALFARRYFVQGALNRDYTLVMGVTILSAALVIALLLLVDLVYSLLDPKVRYEGTS